MDILIAQLAQLSHKPEYGSEEYKNWVAQDDFVYFLQAIPSAPDVILYASVSYTFIYSVLVPKRSVSPPDVEDLDRWNCHPSSSWGFTISFGKRRAVSLSKPLEHTGSKTLDRGEQIVFTREFDGRQEQRSYIEISQKVTHAFGLHWVPEREAYCRFDDRGDVEEIIRVARVFGESAREGRVVTIRRGTLDEYLAVTDQVLLLLYDSTRYESKTFVGWQNQNVEHHVQQPEIHYRIGRNGQTASVVNLTLLYIWRSWP